MVTGDELRAVMRRFPAGVAVVTVDAGAERLGLTVASLVSLSLEPPLIGVSVRRDAALHELLRDAGAFAVSILASGQEAAAAHFARGVPPIALWSGVELRPGEGAPLLDGAVGWLECRVHGECAAGDHTLFLGEVVRAEEGPGRRPLLYVDNRYVAA